MNPVLERFMQSIPLPEPLNNLAEIIDQFGQFSNSFQGDPQQQVHQLLSSGKMTQEEYVQLKGLANRLYPLIKGR